MRREEYEYAGIDPDATNDRGYECGKCGYEPTNRELDNGSCPNCVIDRQAKQGLIA